MRNWPQQTQHTVPTESTLCRDVTDHELPCTSNFTGGVAAGITARTASNQALRPVLAKVAELTKNIPAQNALAFAKGDVWVEDAITIQFMMKPLTKLVNGPAVQATLAGTAAVTGGIAAGVVDGIMRSARGASTFTAARDGATTSACAVVFSAVGAAIASPSVVGAPAGAALGAAVGGAACPPIVDWLQDTFGSKK